MDNKASGLLGFLGLAVAAGVVFGLRGVFPSLARALLIVGGIVVALLVLLVGVILFLALRRPKEEAKTTPQAESAALLAKGRSNLMELRRLGLRVKEPRISKLNGEICAVADKILRTLKDQPEDIPGIRRFFNYYLPTLGSILLKYVQLQESGLPTGEITESTVSCLTDIKAAMEKQYANLFNNDILDLTVEMEVLTQICKRDGLLADDLSPSEGENITLTM